MNRSLNEDDNVTLLKRRGKFSDDPIKIKDKKIHHVNTQTF
jgi:hypothetical protein